MVSMLELQLRMYYLSLQGAFNGEEDIDIDRLREIGLKTEFLGRVGIVFNSN